MSNITNDFNNLLTNLTNNLTLISNSMNLYKPNNLDTQYVKKPSDYMTGTLNINDIDSNSTLNIGQSSNNITIGSQTNSNIQNINIGMNNNNDIININSNLNLNQNRIINLTEGTNNNDSVTLQQINNYINTIKPTKLSQLISLNDSNISLNSYKLTNVSDPINNNDLMNLSKTNTLLPTKLSDLTTLNDSNISLNSYKLTNVKDGTNNNDIVNLSQTLSNINSSKPTKLSEFTTLNDSDISLNSYKITDVTDGLNNKDLVNLSQSTTLINNNKPIKLSQLTGLNNGDISLNNNKLTNVKDGTNNKDVVTLNQLNTLISTSKTSIPFSNINTYPSDINNVFLGDGTFGKVTNSIITDGSINVSKLSGYPNDGKKYLAGDGTFKTVNVAAPNIPGKWELFMSGQGPSSGYIRQNTIVDKSLYPSLSNKLYSGYDIKYTTETLPFINEHMRIMTVGDYIYGIPNSTYYLSYSIDGITWNRVYLSSATQTYWGYMAFSGSIYVLLSTSGYYSAYSTNGTTWTVSQNLPGSPLVSLYTGIAYGNGIFVGCTWYHTIVSNNGTSWTSSTLPISGSSTSIAYTNGLFVIVYANLNTYLTSTDGITWTQRTLPLVIQGTENLMIKYLNGNLIILDRTINGSKKIYKSTNGINWTSYTIDISDLSPYNGQYLDISYGNGIYMISMTVIPKVLWSTNLTIWNTININSANWWYIAYKNGNFITFANQNISTYNKFTITKYENNFNSNVYNLPSIGNWTASTYGNNIYLAIKYNSNQVALSIDGLIWSSQTISSTLNWFNVKYGNGLFVALANYSTTYATSPDGITWTSRTIPYTSSNWNAFIYAGGKFIGLTNEGRVIYSTDGVNWLNNSLPSMISGMVTYGNGLYVATVGDNKLLTSTDGINWTSQTLPVTANFYDIQYINSQFVILDISNRNYLGWSINGFNWNINTINIPNYAVRDGNRFGWRILYYNNMYILAYMGTKYFLYSNDLLTWETFDIPLSSTWYTMSMGNNRLIATNNDGSNSSVLMIENNINTLYNNNLTSPTNFASATIYKYVNNLFYAFIWGSSTYYTSIDGISWTTRNLSISANWCAMTYGNGLYIVLAASSQNYITSIDGINWTQRTISNMPALARFNCFYYTGSHYVAINYGTNDIIYSNDGLTWTVNISPLPGGYCNNVATNGSIYILNSQGNSNYYTSPNGYNNWTSRNFTSSNIVLWQYNIFYGKNLFVGLNISSNYEKSKIIITSNDGINWTERTLPIGGLWYAYTFTNNMFIAFNYGIYDTITSTYIYNGSYVYSSDGINWNYGYINSGYAYNKIASNDKSFILQLGNSSTQYTKVDTFYPLIIPSITEPSGFEYWIVAQ